MEHFAWLHGWLAEARLQQIGAGHWRSPEWQDWYLPRTEPLRIFPVPGRRTCSASLLLPRGTFLLSRRPCHLKGTCMVTCSEINSLIFGASKFYTRYMKIECRARSLFRQNAPGHQHIRP